MATATSGQTSSQGDQLFVSYAREQAVLVKALVDALHTAGLHTWTDVKGLYGGETFWPEIAKAVDAAPAVVVVISPESAASPHCLRELEHAVAVQKRIVPVCVSEPPPGHLPAVVAQIQWIFCETTDVARAATEIAAAVAADWSWLRLGARLLARAAEWRDAGREKSRLLRGAELKEAEAWAAHVPSDGSRPTELHLEFLGVCRIAARQRVRRLSAISVATAAVLTVVATVAWLGRIESVNRLNVDAIANDSAATNPQALVDARRASAMCGWVPIPNATCDHAGEILGVALQINNKFDESIAVFSRSIARLESADEDDRERRLMLADLLWHRSVSRIHGAEWQPDEGVRRGGYANAKVDFERARRIFARWPQDVADRPLSTTAARFDVNAGNYDKAQEILDMESKNFAETEMLRHLTMLCAGHRTESVRFLQKFISDLGGNTDHPVYKRNEPFLTRVRRQCVSQLTQ